MYDNWCYSNVLSSQRIVLHDNWCYSHVSALQRFVLYDKWCFFNVPASRWFIMREMCAALSYLHRKVLSCTTICATLTYTCIAKYHPERQSALLYLTCVVEYRPAGELVPLWILSPSWSCGTWENVQERTEKGVGEKAHRHERSKREIIRWWSLYFSWFFFKLLLGSASREEGSKGISLDLIFGERIPKKDLIFWNLI